MILQVSHWPKEEQPNEASHVLVIPLVVRQEKGYRVWHNGPWEYKPDDCDVVQRMVPHACITTIPRRPASYSFYVHLSTPYWNIIPIHPTRHPWFQTLDHRHGDGEVCTCTSQQRIFLPSHHLLKIFLILSLSKGTSPFQSGKKCTYHCKLIMQPLAAIMSSSCCLGRRHNDSRNISHQRRPGGAMLGGDLARGCQLWQNRGRKEMEDGWRRRGRGLATWLGTQDGILNLTFKDINRKVHENPLFRLGACVNSLISERIGFCFQWSNIFLDNLSLDSALFAGSDDKVEVRTNPVNLENTTTKFV